MPRVHSVLITQCLQRDFVDLVPKDRPLPNKLHVGPEEAERLLGVDPSQGPVASSWRGRARSRRIACRSFTSGTGTTRRIRSKAITWRHSGRTA